MVPIPDRRPRVGPGLGSGPPGASLWAWALATLACVWPPRKAGSLALQRGSRRPLNRGRGAAPPSACCPSRRAGARR